MYLIHPYFLHHIKEHLLKPAISSEHNAYAGSNKTMRKHYVNCIAYMLGAINQSFDKQLSNKCFVLKDYY